MVFTKTSDSVGVNCLVKQSLNIFQFHKKNEQLSHHYLDFLIDFF